jgi:hypothetical protein
VGLFVLAGLLAKNGIQNMVHDSPRTPTARLSAEDAESAVGRVRAALEDEPFTVEDDAARAELA